MSRISWDMQPTRRTIGYTGHERELFELCADWDCVWMPEKTVRRLAVSAGYVWDGASIQRVGWTAIGLTPSGIMDGPSLLHDALYRTKGGRIDEKHIPDKYRIKIKNENGNELFVSRQEADWCLREAMLYAGISIIKANVVYMIVRTFGAIHWGGPIPALRSGK